MIGVWIAVALVVVFLAAVAGSYNRFVRQGNLVQESWRQVDVELRRRHDLIPNVVRTVKGYAAHERNVLQSVTDARALAERRSSTAPEGVTEQARAEGALTHSLGRLLVVAEGYPTLQADAQFGALVRQLTETEDRIAAARRFYNGNVRALNTRVEAFPSSLVASTFGFGKVEYFEAGEPAARAPVTVDFSALDSAPDPALATEARRLPPASTD